MFRRFVLCSGGLFCVQEVCIGFRGLVMCSGGLYCVQEGYYCV